MNQQYTYLSGISAELAEKLSDPNAQITLADLAGITDAHTLYYVVETLNGQNVHPQGPFKPMPSPTPPPNMLTDGTDITANGGVFNAYEQLLENAKLIVTVQLIEGNTRAKIIVKPSMSDWMITGFVNENTLADYPQGTRHQVTRVLMQQVVPGAGGQAMEFVYNNNPEYIYLFPWNFGQSVFHFLKSGYRLNSLKLD